MKKRAKAVAAVLACALALSLASCKGEDGPEQKAELSVPAAEELLAVSAKDLFPLEPGYVLDAMALAGDTLAVAAHRGEDWELALFGRPEAETLDELRLGEAKLIHLGQLCPGAASISGLCSDGESFCLLAQGQPGRRLLWLSEDGRLLSESDCSGLQTGEIGGIALGKRADFAVLRRARSSTRPWSCTGRRPAAPSSSPWSLRRTLSAPCPPAPWGSSSAPRYPAAT